MTLRYLQKEREKKDLLTIVKTLHILQTGRKWVEKCFFVPGLYLPERVSEDESTDSSVMTREWCRGKKRCARKSSC